MNEASDDMRYVPINPHFKCPACNVEGAFCKKRIPIKYREVSRNMIYAVGTLAFAHYTQEYIKLEMGKYLISRIFRPIDSQSFQALSQPLLANELASNLHFNIISHIFYAFAGYFTVKSFKALFRSNQTCIAFPEKSLQPSESKSSSCTDSKNEKTSDLEKEQSSTSSDSSSSPVDISDFDLNPDTLNPDTLNPTTKNAASKQEED